MSGIRRPAPAARQWKSPGPVSSAFIDAPEPVTVLMGPAGGGKTVTSLPCP